MKRLFCLSSCVFLLLVLTGIARSVFAFDIAIYFDSRSRVNWVSCNADSSFSGVPRSTALNNIQTEELAFDYLKGMSITHIITYYPFADDFGAAQSRLQGMKILNWSYPHQAFKYALAQYRDLLVGQRGTDYVDTSCWGNGAGDSTCEGLTVLQMRSSEPRRMWKPQSVLGTWSGWDQREAELNRDIYMKMHYRISCNLRPNGTPPDTQAIATFYWYVADTGSCWWRYPGHVFRAGDFSNPNALDLFEFAIDPHPGMAGTFVQVDGDFNPTTNTATEHTFGHESLDATADRHAFGSGGWTQVRMSIEYCGNSQTFQVYGVRAWDEGYHQLFEDVADTAAFYQELQNSFEQQMNNAGRDTTLAGWYFDETSQSEQIRSLVKVNSLLQHSSSHLPTMWINGHPGIDERPSNWRTQVYSELDSQLVTEMPVFMNEYYFTSDGRECEPKVFSVSPLLAIQTDTSSDVEYVHADPTNCPRVYYERDSSWSQQTYAGFKSLQCALDGMVFGWTPIFPLGNVDLVWPIDAVEQDAFSLTYQCHSVKVTHGGKFWAMLMADDDSDGSDPRLLPEWCPQRVPTPNELKLAGWMAVACDADGLLWYPIKFAAGLLKWRPDSADILAPNRPNLTQTAEVDTAQDGRYSAAAKVDADIAKISPILDLLQFVKTYASRAYEESYPSPYGEAGYRAVQEDTLAAVPWENKNCRAVESITSWAPAAFNQDSTIVTSWATSAEENTYVQISRFKTPVISATAEDYWFLVVNRRALGREFRKIRLTLETDTTTLCYPYWIDYVLGDSAMVAFGPQRAECQPKRYIDVTLAPAEAELIHFYRGAFGCDSTYRHITDLTAIREGDHSIRLNWQPVDTTDYGEPFRVDTFFVSGSPRYDGPFAPMGFTDTTTYVDSAFFAYPKYFYEVQACGEIIEGKTVGLKGTKMKTRIEQPVAPSTLAKTKVGKPAAKIVTASN